MFCKLMSPCISHNSWHAEMKIVHFSLMVPEKLVGESQRTRLVNSRFETWNRANRFFWKKAFQFIQFNAVLCCPLHVTPDLLPFTTMCGGNLSAWHNHPCRPSLWCFEQQRSDPFRMWTQRTQYTFWIQCFQTEYSVHITHSEYSVFRTLVENKCQVSQNWFHMLSVCSSHGTKVITFARLVHKQWGAIRTVSVCGSTTAHWVLWWREEIKNSSYAFGSIALKRRSWGWDCSLKKHLFYTYSIWLDIAKHTTFIMWSLFYNTSSFHCDILQ